MTLTMSAWPKYVTWPHAWWSLPLANETSQLGTYFLLGCVIWVLLSYRHPFYQESTGGWRKDEARPLVRVNDFVPFSALTLMVGWQKGHLTSKIPCSTSPRGSIAEQVEEERRWNRLTKIHAEKWPWNGSSRSREVVVSSRLLMLGLETTSVKRVVMEYFAGLKDHRV